MKSEKNIHTHSRPFYTHSTKRKKNRTQWRCIRKFNCSHFIIRHKSYTRITINFSPLQSNSHFSSRYVNSILRDREESEHGRKQKNRRAKRAARKARHKKKRLKKRGAYIASNENNTKQIKCPDGQFTLFCAAWFFSPLQLVAALTFIIIMPLAVQCQWWLLLSVPFFFVCVSFLEHCCCCCCFFFGIESLFYLLVCVNCLQLSYNWSVTCVLCILYWGRMLGACKPDNNRQ